MPAVDFPDEEAVVRQWLAAANLADVGNRVHTSIPGKAAYPLLIVKQLPIGRPAVKQSLDAAYIQVEAWGTKGTPKSTVRDIANRARWKVHELAGKTVYGAEVKAVEDEVGVAPFDDPLTEGDRYIFAIRLFARAA